MSYLASLTRNKLPNSTNLHMGWDR